MLKVYFDILSSVLCVYPDGCQCSVIALNTAKRSDHKNMTTASDMHGRIKDH